MSLYEELRNKGLKCNCTDCDAYGCGNCLVCRLDEESAKKLLNEILKFEIDWGVKLTILNDPNNKGDNWLY